MLSKKLLPGIVVGVVMGEVFSAAVVLSLEPSGGPTLAGLQTNTFLPLITSATGGTSSAGVPRTGQTTSYGPGDDGALQKGVAWPNPRFTDNSNGTVTDNLTGLIWLKNANCFGTKSWTQALSAANGLASGSCGLSDGSAAGQWRLPNVKELQSLIDFAHDSPALSNVAGTGQWAEGDPFINVQHWSYWSSSSVSNSTGSAWRGYMWDGYVSNSLKDSSFYVWAVRDKK
jgi:hypothetical protein